MKIEKYIKLKSNRYEVLIDGLKVKLYDDVIVKYELLRKKEIDEELFEEITKYNDKLEAYYKALRYLTKKLRTEKEIEDYLRVDYTQKTVDETIDRLKKNGYLNKDIYLKCYLADQINLSNNGPKKIKNSLIKLGYSEEELDERLDSISEEIWLDKIRNSVKKMIAQNKSLSSNKLKEKILYQLSMNGFYKRMIEEVIEESEFKNTDDILVKEYEKAKNKLSKKYDGYELENKILAKLVAKGFYYDDVKRVMNK